MIVLTIKWQQLNRNAIGIELNSEYVEQTKERLNEKFEGFDSIDERMLRIPNDLNDGCYIKIGNFVSHHEYKSEKSPAWSIGLRKGNKRQIRRKI